MGCEICGRNTCTRSFHSLEEQGEFDNVADEVKERMRSILIGQIERLQDKGKDEEEVLVSLSEVIDVINSY